METTKDFDETDLKDCIISTIEILDCMPPKHEIWRQNLINLYGLALFKGDIVYHIVY